MKLFCRAVMYLGYVAFGLANSAVPCLAQGGRRPIRVKAPEFQTSEFDGIFFSDTTSLLLGELPNSQTASLARSPTANSVNNVAPTASSSLGQPDINGDPLAWQNLISPTSLEDLVKGSKLRLEKLITTPAAFAGGGFVEARREFSMQALLFAIIEIYPAEVRWKKSAGLAREVMTRIAANTKVGSIQTFNEAKQRMLDLNDLMNGSQLDGEAKSEVEWSNLVDRVPLMQLLQWAQRDYLEKHTANEASFSANTDEIRRYAQLIAVLGRTALQEDMPDAADSDYVSIATEMIGYAKQVASAADNGNAELARQATGKIGQSCTNCHDNFQ